MKEELGRRTWLALLAFHGILLLLSGIASALMLRGILPADGREVTLRFAWLVASFTAVRLAVKGRRRTLLSAGIVFFLSYLTLFILGRLMIEFPAAVGKWMDAAVFIFLGSLLSVLTAGRGKGRKKQRPTHKRPKHVGNIK